MSTELIIRTPDDFHVHLREDQMMWDVTHFTASRFARALVMPNTNRPILNAGDARAYRDRIIQAAGRSFHPLMTIKLTNFTTPDIIEGATYIDVIAGKIYPEGVTTNSADGVSSIKSLWGVFERMEKTGMVLCIHGERPGTFCMDREEAFLEDFHRIASQFPGLKIVLEHVTTRAAVEAVLSLPENVAATITAHHLVLTLDDVVGGFLNPHHFCKPIAKSPVDRQALRVAATSKSPKFFFGSDTAPHLRTSKECPSGCAGVFSAPCALEVLAMVFESEGKLENLEHFTSIAGAEFYELPPNIGSVRLVMEQWTVPLEICGIVPFMAGKNLHWKFGGSV